MPLYTYCCLNCSQTTEEIRNIGDREPNADCGHCGGIAVFAVSAPQDSRHKGDPRAMTDAALTRSGR